DISFTPNGAIDDSFNFSLDEPGMLQASAVSNNLNGAFEITDGLVTLVKLQDGGGEQVIDSFSFNGITGDVSSDFGEQSVGDYLYRTPGSASGSLGGVYSITSAVAAVPEPGTFAMLLAGIGAMGLLHRRRH